VGTYAELLLQRTDEDKTGLVFEGRSWTWRQIVQECANRAAVLTPGDHVGLLLDNLPDYLFWLGAAALKGAVIVGINPTRRGAQLRGDIDHTDVTRLFTERRHAEDLPDAVLIEDLELPSGTEATIDPSVTEESLLLLLFTSGSTGAPKAVRCSSGRLARVAGGSVQLFNLTRDDVLYQSMPMFHGNALMTNIAPATAVGATVVLRRTFSASGFLPDVRQHNCTFFNYVGRSLAYILATEPREDDADNHLRLGFGTEASPRDMENFTLRFGCPLLDSYGSSEGPVTILKTVDTPRGALGRPPEGTPVVILDGEGNECPRARFSDDGQLLNGDEAIGEIVGTEAASAFEGYYNNPEAEQQRVDGQAYRTGDLGYRDEEGWFWFAGRGGDWLRVDSENFAAGPVEVILSRYEPSVTVAVYPVPDARTGDQVMAALELNCAFDPEDFAAFLRSQPDLGTKWAPRYVRLIAAMPLTGTNKVDKQPMRVEQWLTPDPVFFRPARDLIYRPMTEADRAEVRAAFAEYERRSLLP
jgi:fatty-acyl-CoA synthase